jgi:hypothetical protein
VKLAIFVYFCITRGEKLPSERIPNWIPLNFMRISKVTRSFSNYFPGRKSIFSTTTYRTRIPMSDVRQRNGRVVFSLILDFRRKTRSQHWTLSGLRVTVTYPLDVVNGTKGRKITHWHKETFSYKRLFIPIIIFAHIFWLQRRRRRNCWYGVPIRGCSYHPQEIFKFFLPSPISILKD